MSHLHVYVDLSPRTLSLIITNIRLNGLRLHSFYQLIFLRIFTRLVLTSLPVSLVWLCLGFVYIQVVTTSMCECLDSDWWPSLHLDTDPDDNNHRHL